MPTFGPGELTIGTAAALDVSDLVNGARITVEKDQEDNITKLSGLVRPGRVTYSGTFEGNVDIDPENPSGIFLMSQTMKGQEVDFTFTPNAADGMVASGRVVLDPLDFGADDGDYGKYMTSDFSWSVVGDVTYTPAAP
jgi:hypothetical protein